MPTILHSALTTTDLHEPIGADAASIGQFYVADGAGSGAWGSMQFANIYSSHADSIGVGTIGTTPKKFDGFAHDGPSNGATPAFASHQITVASDGDYWVTLNVSFSTLASGDSGTYLFHVRVDAVESVMGFHRSMSGTSDLGSGTCSGILALTANQVVTVYVESDEAGNSDDIVVNNVALNVVLMKAS